MKPLNLILPITALLAATTIGCGGSTPPAATATMAAPKAAATTPAPAATTPAATAPASTASVTAIEDGDSKYSYDNNKLTLKAGEVTVKLTNKAGNQRPHTFSVKDAAGKDIVKSDRVQPGASADVKFTVAEAGTYQIYCNIMGHADKGQTGTLTVVKG